MAEERLIDDDKDKRYRFRINADGEEELIVDENASPEEEQPATVYEVPEAPVDDEEAAVMTPEQLAAKLEQEEAERRAREEKINSLLESAKKDCAANKFATALEYLEKVEEEDDENGELYAMKLTAYMCNFTDYTAIISAADSADGVKKFTPKERREEMLAACGQGLEDNIAELRKTVSAMNEENEKGKAERAVRFTRDRNVALIIFAVFFACLAGFAAGAGVCATLIFTVSTNLYLVLTCVFGGLAFVALLGAAFAARRLNITSRRVRMNRRNTSTKLGRDLLAEQEKLKAFIAVYSALKD